MTAGVRLEMKGLPIGLTVVETGLITPTYMADSVLSYPPTRASFGRFYKLLLLADAPFVQHALAPRLALPRCLHAHISRPPSGGVVVEHHASSAAVAADAAAVRQQQPFAAAAANINDCCGSARQSNSIRAWSCQT